LIKPPLFVQTIFGILGGIGADHENLLHMKRIADKLFGDDYAWSILAAGRHQMPFVTMGAIMGGNVRVGLEDSLWLGRGQLAQGNADQVNRIRSILENLSLEIATPDEARALLALKGGDDVAFWQQSVIPGRRAAATPEPMCGRPPACKVFVVGTGLVDCGHVS